MVFRLLLAFLLAQVLVMAQQPVAAQEPVTPHRVDTIPAYKKFIDSFQIQPFEKVDLDGNGFTDLLFNGNEAAKPNKRSPILSIAVLSFGNDSFLVKNLPLHTLSTEYFAARVLHFDGQPALQTVNTRWSEQGPECWNDTLIEKTKPVKHHIEKIDYAIGFSQLPGGNLTLKIVGDSARLIKDIWFGLDGLDNGGFFLAKLDWSTELRLYSLLAQMDFSHLKDTYNVTYSDASSGLLHITYDSGRQKTITDRGLTGTYALAELEDLLYNLQKTQHWIEATPLVTRNIDSIHTDAEVLGLVRTLSDPTLDLTPDSVIYALPDYSQRIAAFDAPRWQKADFDGNGHTDLLFNGFQNKDGQSYLSSLVVLSYENDSLLLRNLSSSDAFFSAKSIRFGGRDYINTRHLHAIKDESQEKGYRMQGRDDTLTVINGHLTEQPAKQRQHIQKLTKCAGGNYDKIEFTRDTIWWYKYVGAAFMPLLDSHALYFTVDTSASNEMLDLAGSINTSRLDPNYERENKDWLFYTTWTFETADGHQTKISSDDVKGSYSLQTLDFFVDNYIRQPVNWQLYRPNVAVICDCDRIDSLHTDEQVLSFIRGLNHSRWPTATFYPPQSPYRQQLMQRLDSFGAKPYEKLDLDNNGLTDLLFNGYESDYGRRLSLLILALDKDSFLIKELPKELHPIFFAAKMIRTDGHQQLQTLTECYGEHATIGNVYFQTRVDTLVWQYPGLIEVSHPSWQTSQHKIDTLRFLFNGGGIMYSLLQLTVMGDNVTLEKSCEIQPQTPIDSGGMFKAKMNFVTSERLYALLDAIGFEQLNKAYAAPGNDQSSSDFEIQYDQGKRKTIYDCENAGPYALNTLENLLLTLLKTLHWKRIGAGGPGYFLIQDFYESPF
jgi:hypothetical protein